MSKKLRVTFIIPFTAKTGGIAVVLEYYGQLTAMGCEVNVIYPLIPYKECLYHESQRSVCKKIHARLKGFLSNLKKNIRAIDYFSKNIPIKPVLTINNRSIPDADIVIATAWPTAYNVNRLSSKKGRKYYFVQDYENWNGWAERVDNSYRLPLGLMAIAPWLAELMKEKFGRDDVTEINNGIRLDKFYPPVIKNFDRMSILFMAHDLESKGAQDAIDALAIVKERYPRLKIKAFGICARPAAPFDFEYCQNPPYEKLLSLYQETAIFIFPSQKEGWGLTPIEAMACGCAVVATNVGCIPLINNGGNMILAEVKNPASIADGVIKLLDDRVLAEKIAAQGLKSVQEMGWEKSAQKLLQTFLS
jgi:glycosyltransferase involved in cell wall biosynthesis